MDIILFGCLILIPISIYTGLSKVAKAINPPKLSDTTIRDLLGRPKKSEIIKKSFDIEELLK